jgi:uncharacterized membrane protein
MKKIKKNIAITFGVVVVVFAIPIILSIWQVIDPEFGVKSAWTLLVVFLCLWIVAVITNNLNKGK